MRTLKIAPLILTDKAYKAYSLLIEQISILAGLGIHVPCVLDPLMWDTAVRRRDSALDRNFSQQVAILAIRRCYGCDALTLCRIYKETGAIREGVLAGEWLGARNKRKTK